jgi:hypothetical protein
MAKIVLGQRPEKFSRAVKFALLDNSTAWINVDFKYRTRSEYGAFVDTSVERSKKAAADALKQAIEAAELAASAGADDASYIEKLPGMKDVLDKSSAENVEFLLEVVTGWNLDASLGRDSIVQLVDEYPQAALAIIDTYRLACTEGRQGN